MRGLDEVGLHVSVLVLRVIPHCGSGSRWTILSLELHLPILFAQVLLIEPHHYFNPLLSRQTRFISLYLKALGQLLARIKLSSHLRPVDLHCERENIDVFLHVSVEEDALFLSFYGQLIGEFPVAETDKLEGLQLGNYTLKQHYLELKLL